MNEIALINTLRFVGVRPDLKGWDYLKEAVKLVMEDRDKLHAMTKELYPTVAKTFKTTSSRVERAMRHAIEVAFSNMPAKVVDKVFGNTVSYETGKATNSQFIASIVEYLKTEVTA